MKYLLTLALGVFSLTGFAQKVVKSTGVGEVEYSTSLSENEAKHLAKDQASISALENAFGTVIVDGSATYVSNTQSNKRNESTSVYNFISNKAVSGEVIEVLSEEYNVTTKKVEAGTDTLKIRFMQCTINVSAKELVAPPLQFDAYPLGCENKKCKTLDFKDGDDFFYYFSSPISGYLWIYLDDGKQAQCLLPYSNMPATFEGGFPVQADKEYVFFSNSAKNHNLENLNFTIDTYQLTSEKAQDLNRAFVVFSEKPLSKPKMQDGMNKQSLTKAEVEAGYSVPKALSSEDFQRWIIKNRSYKNVQISVKVADISIIK
jgi:hypothetical protein